MKNITHSKSINKLFSLTLATLSGFLLLVFALLALGNKTSISHAAPIEPPEGYPKLSLSVKMVTPTLVNVDNVTLTYFIEILNTGAYTAAGTRLVDFLPENTTYNNDASASVSGTIAATATTLSWQGDVGFDSSVVFSFSVTANTIGDGLFTNTAIISHPMIAEPITVTAKTIMTDNPIFSIEKTSLPAKPGANKPLMYKLRVSNYGQPAINLPITVTDQVPQDTTFLDADSDGSSDGSVVTWTRVVSLEFGESTSFSFTVMVDDVISGTVITNANYSVVSTATQQANGDVYTSTIIDPIFTLFKEIVPDPPGSNNSAMYVLTLLNSGSLATELVITDTVPQYAIYHPGGSGTFGNETVLWEWPSLDTGEIVNFTYTVSFSDIAAVNILNDDYAVCSAEGVCQFGEVLTSVVAPANFETYAEVYPIAKKPGGGGGPVTPTLVARNIGPGNALSATALIKFERISVSANDMVYTPTVGQLSDAIKCGDKCTSFVWVGDLAVGEAITFTTIEGGQSTIGGEEGTNYTATIIITDSLSTIISGTWEEYVTEPVTGAAVGKVTHLAYLNPTKFAPEIIGRGQVMTYHLNVWNSALSNDAPPYPYLLDFPPTGTTIISISHGGVYTDILIADGSASLLVKAISWTLPALSTGERVDRYFKVRVDNDLISGTKIINNYESHWYENDATYQGYTYTVGVPVTTTVQEVGLIDSYKEVTPKVALPGPYNILTYTIHVVNSSGIDLTKVEFHDVLPWQNSTYQRDAVASSGSIISDIVTIDWTGNIGAYDEEVITFTVLVDNGFTGAITNTAIITHSDLLTAVQVEAVAYITEEPVLRITKVASPDPVKVGNDLHYTIKVVNLGQQASNLVITDVIPANTAYNVGSATAGANFDGTQLKWESALLNPGQAKFFKFDVTVEGGSQIVNSLYGVSSKEGVKALGVPVITKVEGGSTGVYLPIILK